MMRLPDCRAASRLLSDALDAELPAASRVPMQLHLATCRTCRHVEAQFGVLRSAVRRLGQGAEPPRAGFSRRP
jgi:predicted anti-sigma-YlaC factor YlaD